MSTGWGRSRGWAGVGAVGVMAPLYAEGATGSGVRRATLFPVLALVLLGACGRGGDGEDTNVATGRVMSIDADRACVSPDRGATTRCLGFFEDGRPAIEVGQCVRMTPGPTLEANRFEVVPDAACAAGDVGD